jgi:hypothetical protein
LSFLLCLCLFFNKISHKGRNGTCLKLRRGGGKGEGGGQGAEMTQTMYAHNKKQKILRKNKLTQESQRYRKINICCSLKKQKMSSHAFAKR